MQMASRLGITNQKLIRIIEAMEAHLEAPLGGDDLSDLSGVSSRQIERLFRAHVKDTPSGYYLKLRLQRARHLLRQTGLSVMEVAMATGFSSASSLSRAYRARFGHSPRQDRVEPTTGGTERR
jgi:AraC family carnitine catabolism transcriptional activator